MPQTLSQWLAFVAVVAGGVVVSLRIQRFFMKKCLNPEKLADQILAKLNKTEEEKAAWRKDHLGTSLQEWVGAMEIVLYSTAIVFNYAEFIAVWFATKYIATWKGWAEEQAARSFYNRSLFGSGLNILLGAATGGVTLVLVGVLASTQDSQAYQAPATHATILAGATADAVSITLTDFLAILGAVLGTIGTVLGILNHLRDRPRVLVRLLWDMSVTDNPLYDSQKKWGFVTVANVGRRPIYISHASIALPKGYDHNHLVLWEGLRGQKLAEGDPPVDYVVSQDDLGKYKKDWEKLRAMVVDTAGKKYYSKVDKAKRPSWAD